MGRKGAGRGGRRAQATRTVRVTDVMVTPTVEMSLTSRGRHSPVQPGQPWERNSRGKIQVSSHTRGESRGAEASCASATGKSKFLSNPAR